MALGTLAASVHQPGEGREHECVLWRPVGEFVSRSTGEAVPAAGATLFVALPPQRALSMN